MAKQEGRGQLKKGGGAPEDIPGTRYTRQEDSVTLTRHSIWLRQGQYKQIKLIAVKTDKTIGEVFQEMVDNYIEQHS